MTWTTTKENRHIMLKPFRRKHINIIIINRRKRLLLKFFIIIN